MRLKKVLILCLALIPLWSFTQEKQEKEKYWVFFTDKGDLSQIAPEDILSSRSLERRAKQNIPVTESDYPVNRDYLSRYQSAGFAVEQTSKWFNGVSSWLSDAELQQVQSLPFVKSVRFIPPVRVDYDAPAPNTKNGYSVGFTFSQITMLGLDQIHQQGLLGEGMLIAVMDNGFINVDQNPLLSHLHEDGRIVATHDFVNGEDNVYDQGSHGAWVLSILAAYHQDPFNSDNNFVGSAPGASYILCHTENDLAEEHREEDNWVAAMEYADSIGADIFSTSLGYSNGMQDTILINGQPVVNYDYSHFDGNTAIITIGADMAAAKGILVVNSAGNNGQGKLNAPADGDSVMAIGAVDRMEQLASFSSWGPTADGRIKPDVCAMGQATAFVHTNGNYSVGNGTSFSCPMMSGFAACLWQSNRSLGNMELFQKILESCDRYTSPDTLYGYGIPDGVAAYEDITGNTIGAIPNTADVNDYGVFIYPNPTTDEFQIIYYNGNERFEGALEMFDVSGRRVAALDLEVAPFVNRFHIQRGTHFPDVPYGYYIIRLRNLNTSSFVFEGKIRIER